MECPGCHGVVDDRAAECPRCGEELPGAMAAAARSARPGPPPVRPPDRAGGYGDPYQRVGPAPVPPPRAPFSAAAVIAAACAVLLIGGVTGYYLLHRSGTAGGGPQGDGATTAPPSPVPPAPVRTVTPDPTTSTSTTTSTTTTTVTVPGYPALSLPGHECARNGTGPYAAVAVANTVTSCPFALNVRDAYLQSGADGAAVVLNVFSPVTSQWYAMQCTGTQPVTCTGGNSAVVYLYGGSASFTG